MFIDENKCGNFYCSINYIFLNPNCEKTRKNTLQIFVFVFSKPLNTSLTNYLKKSKYTLRTKFKVKVKVKRSTL